MLGTLVHSHAHNISQSQIFQLIVMFVPRLLLLWTSLIPSMAWRSSSTTHEGLVNNLVSGGIIQSDAVAKAMKTVDRRYYVKPGQDPYQDSPQVIGMCKLNGCCALRGVVCVLVTRTMQSGGGVGSWEMGCGVWELKVNCSSPLF